MNMHNIEKDFYSLEESFNEKTKEGKIYLCKWIESIEKIKKIIKKKDATLFIYGVYNSKTGKISSNGKQGKINAYYDKIGEYKKNSGRGKIYDSSKSAVYDKLCLGLRFIELTIFNNVTDLQCDDIDMIKERQKGGIICLFEGKYYYELSDILQQIFLFLNEKKERIILSFLENQENENENEESENEENEEIENEEIENEENEEIEKRGENIVSEFAVQQIDTYVYLYLRKYLSVNDSTNYGSNRKENNSCLTKSEILYFYNNRKRILNLKKYNFDINNMEIHNWVFNNISLFFPSEKVIDETEENRNYKNTLSLNDTSDLIKKNKKDQNLLKVCKSNVSKENTENNNSFLTHKMHLSLFRLNSIAEKEICNLSEKIIIKKKLPNISVFNENDDGNFNISQNNYIFNSSINKTSNLSNTLNNACILYLQFRVNKNDVHFKDNQTTIDFKEIKVHDNNFNANRNFIGYNKLPLIEYQIDVPKKMQLLESPFIFTGEKLTYINGKIEKKNFTNSENLYYIIKIENQNLEEILIYLQENEDKQNVPQFIIILKYKFDIFDICSVIKYNLKSIFS